ncbi:MAG: hypothetical protein JXQ76_07550 [Campylobacterales bacterium]|nr:hypothetical protein [Campylobacterales bacterium]
MKANHKSWLIDVERDGLARAGVAISAAFTTYGLSTFWGKLSGDNLLYFWLGVFAILGIFLIIEHIGTVAYTIYLNSRLDHKVSSLARENKQDEKVDAIVHKYKVRNGMLMISIFIAITIFASDIFGGFSFRDTVFQHFKSDYIANDHGKEAKHKWESAEAAMIAKCDSDWKGSNWRTKNAECKDKWYQNHPRDSYSANNTERKAIDYAEDYKLPAMVLFIVIAIIAQILAKLKPYRDYEKLIKDIELYPEDYATDFKHAIECDRIATNAAMNVRVDERKQKLDLDIKKLQEAALSRINTDRAATQVYLQSIKDKEKRFKPLLNPINNDRESASNIGFYTKSADENYKEPEPLQEGRASSTVETVEVDRDEPIPHKPPIGFKVNQEFEEALMTKSEKDYGISSKINFTKDDLVIGVKLSYRYGSVKVGEYTASKQELLGEMPTTLSGDKMDVVHITNLIKKPLKEIGAIEYIKGRGDVALMSMEEALEALDEK